MARKLKKISLVKKSFYNYIINVFQEGTSYTVGSGKDDLKIHEQYPVTPKGFTTPAIAFDIDRVALRVEYDLGQSAYYEYDLSVDIYARNNLEREYLLEVISEDLEQNTVPLYDYNSASNDLLGNLQLISFDGGPIRIPTPTEEEKFKFNVTFTFRTVLDYE